MCLFINTQAAACISEDAFDKQDRVLDSKLDELVQLTTLLAKTPDFLPDTATTAMGLLWAAFTGDNQDQPNDTGRMLPDGSLDGVRQNDLASERAGRQVAALFALEEHISEETQVVVSLMAMKELKPTIKHMVMKVEARTRCWA